MTPRPPTILCVDDEPANLKLLENILVPRGHTVVTAANGRDALETLRSREIDLVLLDVIMPGMDGFSVCRQIKEDEGLRSVPVVLITAMTAKQERIRGIEAGAEEFLSKPFDQTEALARIGMLLKVKGLDDDRKRVAEALKESNDRLREMETLRDSLVHMVVHDLRNPLTVITMFANLLDSATSESLSEKGRRYVHHIIDSADFLTELCSSMLDVSKMESGQIQMNLTACDLSAIVHEVVSRMDDPEAGHRIALALLDTPLFVRGDSQLLARLIQNLVGNALKFVPADGGRVAVDVSPREDQVRCTVKDNGPGIPPEQQAKVFDKFWQGSAPQGGKPSSGLGLTFCKMVVEAHGGKIGVESVVGTGSTFWFELPQAAKGNERDGPAVAGHDGSELVG